MTKTDKVLVILLRYFLGIPGLFALVAVFMPLSWMVATHRWLGLGEMPTAPVVEYLARSVSAFYALFGALFVVVASDLERYRPVVRLLGIALALVGFILLGVDIGAGMTWWWSAFEGPLWVVIGAAIFFLSGSIEDRKGYRGLPMEGIVARWYAKKTAKDIEFRKAAQGVADQLPSGGKVLEVAPGPGYFAIELAKLGSYQITGLDISKSFVQIATENAKRAGVGITFLEGNASSMPFDSGSFDFIYCRSAFKNLSEPVQAINEMYRVLKPGGKAVIHDLRNDASTDAINSVVSEMQMDRLNSLITRWIFRHMLLKMAFSPEEVRAMAAQTPFGTCEVKLDRIGMEVTLQK